MSTTNSNHPQLRPQLTNVTETELQTLHTLTSGFVFDDGADVQTYVWDSSSTFSSSAAYRSLTATGERDPNGC